MKHANPNFYKVEPYGNVGDEGCDGFDPDKGIYYQIYAPKTIELKKVTDKLNANFERLYLKWNTRSNIPVEEFYFVMNDKYKGTRVPLEIGLSEIDAEMKKVNSNYPTLRKTGRLLSDDLERIFFENLSEEQLTSKPVIFLKNHPLKPFSNMILPTKHIRIAESLIGLSSFVLSTIKQPMPLEQIWEEYQKQYKSKKYPAYHSFDNLILTIDYLYMIDAIDLNPHGQVFNKHIVQ
jgi:hypothetical protein